MQVCVTVVVTVVAIWVVAIWVVAFIMPEVMVFEVDTVVMEAMEAMDTVADMDTVAMAVRFLS
jgi:hypothetical protein